MKILSLPSRKSNVILLILLLAVGLIPVEVTALNFLLGDDEWFRVWYNEGLAWGGILTVFNILALFRSLNLFRQAPGFCGLISAVAVLGICIVVVAVIHEGLGPSSKEDSPNLEMWEFWSTGGGWVTWIAILPLGTAYFTLLAKEHRQRAK